MDNEQIFDYINDLRKESKQEHELLHKRISDMKDELLAEMKEIRKEQTEVNKRMDERVSSLERWKWTLIGGAIVVGFILSGGIDKISNILS
tara:strand:- start:331 stop:603 length:273 start_codon:yes stop_codon:yes gene_type:complete